MNVRSLKMQLSAAAAGGSSSGGTFNNNNNSVTSPNSSSSNSRNGNASFLRTHIPVSSSRSGRSNNNINNVLTNSCTSPVPNSDALSSANEKWKVKFDEEERRRKTLLMQNQKLSREYDELKRRFTKSQDELKTKTKQLSDKEQEFTHLRKLSEAVCKEYDQMKTQYDLETTTMQKAMKRASKWYTENKELKRRSTILIDKVMQLSPDMQLLQQLEKLSDDQIDSKTNNATIPEQPSDDIEELNKIILELNKEVARLQAELNAARLQEFEAQEQSVEFTTLLDEEQSKRKLLESELQELRRMKENLSEVSRLVAAEVSALKEQSSHDRQLAEKFKVDADKAKRERNVLAHQSQLLMSEVSSDDRLINVLLEVEQLMSCLEEERQRHAAEVQQLQEKLESQESNERTEVLEQRLKLTESELVCASERADRAETQVAQLYEKVSKLESNLEEMKQQSVNIPPPPPPPLPPPPPPLPLQPLLSAPSPVSINLRTSNSDSSGGTESAIVEMASLLGISRKPAKQNQGAPGAIDDIINQIKGGRFTLKATEKPPKVVKPEVMPPAVQEMMNVLGTLRRRPKHKPAADNSSANANGSDRHTSAPADIAL